MDNNTEKKEMQEKRNHTYLGKQSRFSSGGSSFSLQPALRLLEAESGREINIGSLLQPTSSASIFQGIKKFYRENHIQFAPAPLILERETAEDYKEIFEYLQITN